jgi:hypothetical protein
MTPLGHEFMMIQELVSGSTNVGMRYFLSFWPTMLYLAPVAVSSLTVSEYRPVPATVQPRSIKGLFGWAVAVEKVAVGCALWKKLL